MKIEIKCETNEVNGDIELFADNGGGLTLQTGTYCHTYWSDKEIAECAEAIRAMLRGESTDDWEGNNPENRMEYHYEDDRNGHYDYFDTADLRKNLENLNGFGHAIEQLQRELQNKG